VTHDTVIDRDVLLLLLDLGFDKAHWQLDAVWSPSWPIGRWARESYLPGLRRLAERVAEKPWERLSRVPFYGIVSALYNGGYRWYPCGAGRGAVAVNTRREDTRLSYCSSRGVGGVGLAGRVERTASASETSPRAMPGAQLPPAMRRQLSLRSDEGRVLASGAARGAGTGSPGEPSTLSYRW